MGKDKIVLVILLIGAAFLIGSMWTKIQTLEKGAKQKGQAVVVTPQPTGTVGGAQAVSGKVEVAITPNDLVKGNPQAKVTIIEFSDFQCPFCGRAEPTLKQIFETYGDGVKLVYKNYPLPFHEYAQDAAIAALCAKDQGKFWEYHDTLFKNQESLKITDLKKYASDLGLKTQDFNTCLDSKKYKDQVQADLAEGNRAGVSGTPAFFINGRPLSGAQPFDSFKAVIDEELKK